MILWTTVGLSVLIYLVGLRMRLEWLAVTMTLTPLFSLYILLIYEKTIIKWIPIILVSAVALATICFMSLIKQKAKALRPVAAIALLVVMGVVVVRGYFIPSTPVTIITETDQQTIANNIDTLLLLQEENWCALGTDQKLEVLQTIANVETRYLGLPHALNVRAENLSEEGVLATYTDLTHTISIDLDHLENDAVQAVLNSCCHEAYHSYTYRLVDAYNAADQNHRRLLIYKLAEQYGQELSSYDGGENDFSSYYFQTCEMHARAYAKNAVEEYYNRIEEYSQETLKD